MTTKIFKKVATTIDEQICQLRTRGLIFSEVEEQSLRNALEHINYYVLSGYWRIFEIDTKTEHLHKFHADTTWKKIKDIYDFDVRFRQIILTACQKMEVSIKTRWAYELSHTYGAFPQDDPNVFSPYIFKSPNGKLSCYERLLHTYKKSNEVYAKHYRTNYSQLRTPPAWVTASLFTMGEVVNWIKYLKRPKDRKNILNVYGLDEKIMVSFLSHLVWVRNICAHNNRLWNRNINMPFSLPSNKRIKLIEYLITSQSNQPKIYNTIIMLHFILKKIDVEYQFLSSIREAIEKHPSVATNYMGFPEDWALLDIWQKKLT